MKYINRTCSRERYVNGQIVTLKNIVLILNIMHIASFYNCITLEFDTKYIHRDTVALPLLLHRILIISSVIPLNK